MAASGGRYCEPNLDVDLIEHGDKSLDKLDSIANALGCDATKLRADADAAAMEAGCCDGSVCTAADIEVWARKHGKALPGKLGAYAVAVAELAQLHEIDENTIRLHAFIILQEWCKSLIL